MNSLTSKRSSILVFPVQYNSCCMSKEEVFQVTPTTNFCTHSNWSAVCLRYKSEVKQLLPVDSGPPTQTLFQTLSKSFLSSRCQNLISVPSYPVLPYNSPTTHIKFSWTVADNNYRLAGKFDREMNLAVGVETAKLKSTSIISYATCNDIMHALALLAPSSAPLCELYL